MTSTELMNAIEREASLRGEPIEIALRHHLLTNVVHRIARSSERESFVLRGGLLTRAWIAPRSRPTRDLDFVGDFTFNVDDCARRFTSAVQSPTDDALVLIDPQIVTQGLWQDTEFPGVRFTLRLGIEGIVTDQPLSIDVGFRDPLVPTPVWTEIDHVEVRAIRPETQVSWKLHALAEMGESFRPKDLADLWRIITASSIKLIDADLPLAIHAAFTSRGYTLEQARAVLSQPHWETKTARVRWSPDRSGVGLPPLPKVLKDVRARLAPIFKDLSIDAK